MGTTHTLKNYRLHKKENEKGHKKIQYKESTKHER